MTDFRKILLAVDEEGYAEGAIGAVADIALSRGAEVRVLTVLDSARAVAFPDTAQSYAQEVAWRLREAGVTARGEVRRVPRGRVAETIVAAAREYGADLVALGSHGRTDLGSLLLGSVGHRVAARLDRTVLLARAARNPAEPPLGATGIRRVLLAVDASERATDAIRAVQDLVQESGAAVMVVHVLETAPIAGAISWAEPWGEAQRLLKETVAALEAPRRTVVSRVLDGPGQIAELIAAASDSWDADVIVIGSRRPSDLGGLIAGSVAHELLRETTRPVLLAERTIAV